MHTANKEKLLEYLEDWKMDIEMEWGAWSEDEEQAYQKIRQLIESQPICIFCALPITGKEGACGECANRALEDLSLLSKRRKI